MPIGTLELRLRGDRMYEFLDRFIAVALPSVPETSRGIKATKALMVEEIILLVLRSKLSFLKLDIDKVNKMSGMDITFVTTAKTNTEAIALLTELGLPFAKNKIRWQKNQ